MRVGDLVTYAGESFQTPRIRSQFIGVIVQRSDDGYAGHVVVYWLKHTSFEGQQKWLHSSSVQLIEESP